MMEVLSFSINLLFHLKCLLNWEKLITPDPINFEIAIGKKDDFAGSVYVYYIDENKHNYNTSYVTFELEYKKQ